MPDARRVARVPNKQFAPRTLSALRIDQTERPCRVGLLSRSTGPEAPGSLEFSSLEPQTGLGAPFFFEKNCPINEALEVADVRGFKGTSG